MAEPPDGTPRLRTDGPESKLLVVGLGASAGGIKALKDFFVNVDRGRGIAYVVILHLSPDHDSLLAEVLQTSTEMPVAQVTASVPIERDRVYVIPPNKSLSITDGMLTVSEITRREQRISPVDIFFRALADSHRSRAACVILSGTGANGSGGLKRVKQYGGLVLAQDPDEAEYADMPRNAIETGLVDLMLPVAQMPARIAAYFENLDVGVQETAEVDESDDADRTALRDVLSLLRVRTGHDFSNYKTATVRRRIQRRMSLHEIADLGDYSRMIRARPDEAPELMKELLISVTSFFRDSATWASLEQRIIPRLFNDKHDTEQVRVWVPGCATGEEAYSLAMLLAEHASATADGLSLQIFATDLDPTAIAAGREGLYSEAEIADVSDERLNRFFHREADGFRVRRELREMVLFAHHNVIKDPPFSHLDLVSCRNLLIYLNRSIQTQVIETFHFALHPGGFLVVGTAESVDGASDLFLRVHGVPQTYENRAVTNRQGPAVGYTLQTTSHPMEPVPGKRATDRHSPADLHMRLLEEYAPPSVLVTEEHAVVHMSEHAGRFMHVRGGEPTRDLLQLVQPELRTDLRSALHQAAAGRTEVAIHGVAISAERDVPTVDITVKPVLREGDPARGFFLVTFGEGSRQPAAPAILSLTSPAESMTAHLEDELARVRAHLRSTIEQYETQTEETKASNEELQAMNEELRSAAEELETSKEELQSVNEELITVNQELKIKIEELSVTNNDFQNLINATDIGTIFLDRHLRVKFSTPRAREVFNLLETDIGRSLSDITSRFRYEVQDDLKAVLDKLTPIEREVQADNAKWHLMRLLPYRTGDNRIDGVAMTFLDITERRASEERVRQSEERLRMLIDSALDYAIFTTLENGVIDSWNLGAERMFGYKPQQILGSPIDVLFTPEDRDAGVPARELDEARRAGRAGDERYHIRSDGSRFYASGITRPLGSGGVGFAKIARDLSGQQEAADALQNAHDELETRVRNRTTELQLSVSEHKAARSAVTHVLRRLVSAQEDERRRIARDIHDHFGQQLTALRLALERSQLHRPASHDEIDRALVLTKQLSNDLEFLAWELRPAALDELGLAAALPRFVTEWSAHVGIPAEFRLGGYEPGQLAREAEVAFYRVAQESLNNVSKHAHASRADVVLASNDGHVVLVVEDDGIGFDPSQEQRLARGSGLTGMRERASLAGATLQIESAPGRGTSVFLRCPVNRPDKADTPR